MDLSDLKDFMKKEAQADRNKKSTQVSGSTLKEALSHASMELALPIKKINYEVLQKGVPGVLGVGKKDWLIIAYASSDAGKKAAAESDAYDIPGMEEIEIEEDRDGRFFLRLLHDKVSLKVVPPLGAGVDVSLKKMEEGLAMRGVSDYRKDQLKKILRTADSEFHEIGSYIHNPPADALLDISMDEYDMNATLVFTPPGHQGEDLEADTILDFLNQHGIVFGIQDEAIKEFVENPDYSAPLICAIGREAQDGANAHIEYLFETDRQHLSLEEVNGRVDFKNMKMIQNVHEGDILARKHPAGEGEDGSTVLGRILPSRPGKDIPFEVGQNVELIENDTVAKALMDGQVLLVNNKVSVDPVYVIKGDVNIKTGGNVDFIGTVIVKGNVEDGFYVKATKNIEIAGTVGKCEIQAGGDIMVSQGINGRDGGNVVAKGSVFAKFIENSHVKAEEDIVVHDGIVNSVVEAKNMIKCVSGKRAAIVGGISRAAKGMVAKTLGTIAGSETIVEVGFDPEKRERFLFLETSLESITSELSEVTLNVNTLLKTGQRGGLPAEKKESLQKLRLRQEELNVELSNYTEEYNHLKEYLDNLKSGAEVAVEGKTFPGVKFNISGAEMRVRNEMKLSTFYKEGPVVKIKVYSDKESKE